MVVACDGSGDCGPPGAADSGGFFNVSAPYNAPDTLLLTGGGPSGYGNSLPGYNTSRLVFSATIPDTRYNGSEAGGATGLEILGGEAGDLTEVVGATSPPAFFATFGVESNGPVLGIASFVTGPGGYHVGFLPNGASSIRVSGGAAGLVPARSNASAGMLPGGVVVAGPTVAMSEFGFVTATIRESGSLLPLSGIEFEASGLGGPLSRPLSGASLSNGTGFVNTSAPPGNDTLTTGSPAFANFTGTTTVVNRTTDAYGTITVAALAGDGYADVRSLEVNTVGVPVVPGVFDNTTDLPVLGLQVAENALGIHSQIVFGSDLGQYYLSALPTSAANVTFTALGYTDFTLHENLSYGTDVVDPQLNMTANGVVEGTVVAEPGNVSVPYATVWVCPVGTTVCLNHVETNVSGVFWIGAAAGVDQVTVDSPLYLSNISKLVNVTPDSFVELGSVPVFTFGTVHGVVRSLPHGDLLVGANVSICSRYSGPGGCLPDETVTTDANGTFSVQSPPGTYYLYADASGVQRHSVPDRDRAGGGPRRRHLVPPIVRERLGRGGQRHRSADRERHRASLPDVRRAVQRRRTDARERLVRALRFPGPEHPHGLSGRISRFVGDGRRDLGRHRACGPPRPDPYPAGRLRERERCRYGRGDRRRPRQRPRGRRGGGGRVAQAVTGGGGDYRFEVRWGTVEVVVGEPNYRSENATLTVHTNLTGVNFALPTMTYLVEGVTSDGDTGSILAGVTIANNGTTMARSDANGAYRLELPNGTTTLTASYPTNGTIQYGSVRVPIQVTGASVVHNIALPRTEVPLRGVVVDAATGRPLTAASVTLWTTTGRGEGTRSTDANGEFTFGTGPGTYNVSVTAPGFQAANVTVSTGVAGNYTTVSLQPVPNGSGSSGIPVAELAVLGGGAVAVGVAAVIAVQSGRRRAPPEDSEPAEMLPVYEEEPR